MDSLRQRQIDEVLQYDKVINSRVFGREVDQVAQFNDPRSRPNKDDITFQAEVEKRVQEIMTIIQKIMNSIGQEDIPINLSGPSDGEGGEDEEEEGAGRQLFRRGRKVGGVNGELTKNLKSLVESKSEREKLNDTSNLTADILNRYNSLIDYILQYKRYTIYGNQSVQDAQFSADKVKQLLQPLKGLLLKIQSSGDDQLFTKTYNVVNKIIESIENAPPFLKVDNEELNKEVIPQDVSQLRKYGVTLGAKLHNLDEKIKKAKSYVPISQREKDGQAELVSQLEREKAKLKQNWDELEKPEVQHAIGLYDQLEDETLDPDDREEIKRSIELFLRSARNSEFPEDSIAQLEEKLDDLVADGVIGEDEKDRVLSQAKQKVKKNEGPTILTDKYDVQEKSRATRQKQVQSRYETRLQNANRRVRDYEEAIKKALVLRKREDRLNNNIASRNASIKPTTATRRRNQIRAMNATDQAEIARIQADRDYMDDAEIRDMRDLISDEKRDISDLMDEYNKALVASGKRKKGGRKFTPQYAPDLEDYDEMEYGDTNKTDNLENLDEDYIVDEDDIQVGGRRQSLQTDPKGSGKHSLSSDLQKIMKVKGKGKKVCMPKNTYLNEHHHLINLLDEASGKLGKEARKQKKELEGGRARVNPGWTKESFEARQKQGFYKNMTWEQFQESQRKFYEDSEKMKARLAKQQQEYEEQIKRDPDSEIIWCKIDANGDRVTKGLGDQATKRECKARHEKNYEKTDPIGAKFFSPLVKGLTKLGDLAINIAPAIGVPSVVTEGYKAFAPPGSQYYKGNGKKKGGSKYDADPLKKGNFTKKNEYASIVSKQLYPKGRIGPSNEDNDKAYNMAMAIDKASRKKVQLGKEDVKALAPVLPLGGIPELGASGAGKVTKGEDFGALLAKLKDGKKSRELKKAKKTVKVKGGALSFDDDNNDMYD